jgi:hypothetical protein
MYWPGGEPLDELDIHTASTYISEQPEARYHHLDTDGVLPFVSIDLSVAVEPELIMADIAAAEDAFASLEPQEDTSYAKQLVFRKGLVVVLGSLASVGIQAEHVELSDAYGMTTSRLIEDRKAKERADLPYIASELVTAYSMTEVVRSVYIQEREAAAFELQFAH